MVMAKQSVNTHKTRNSRLSTFSIEGFFLTNVYNVFLVNLFHCYCGSFRTPHNPAIIKRMVSFADQVFRINYLTFIAIFSHFYSEFSRVYVILDMEDYTRNVRVKSCPVLLYLRLFWAFVSTILRIYFLI